MKAERIGILSALLASSCCLGPIALVLLGLGSVGLVPLLGKYHWYLQGAAVAVLVLGWWIFLREKRRMNALGSELRNERLTRTTLSVVTLIVTIFIGLNSYTSLRADAGKEGVAAGQLGAAVATLPVEGMSCFTCELAVEASLKRLEGVYEAKASAAAKAVTVNYDPKRVSLRRMVEAISRDTGYKASLPE